MSNNKFCKDRLINKVLVELRKDLSLDNQIFISEADLQFSFAKKLYELLDKEEKIILEYPITTEKLYSQASVENINAIKLKLKNKRLCKSCTKENIICVSCDKLVERYLHSRESIDLFFSYKNTYYFIEFKYKLNKIDESVCRYDDVLCDKFNVKMHGADDLGRYSVYEDLERLENIKKITKKIKNAKCKACVIFITNQNTYWSLNQTEGKLACNMPLATDDKNNSVESTKNGQLRFGSDSNKTKERTLFLENKYELSWNTFKELSSTNKSKNSLFKCLVIEL